MTIPDRQLSNEEIDALRSSAGRSFTTEEMDQIIKNRPDLTYESLAQPFLLNNLLKDQNVTLGFFLKGLEGPEGSEYDPNAPVGPPGAPGDPGLAGPPGLPGAPGFPGATGE